jgi:hypothetical protein
MKKIVIHLVILSLFSGCSMLRSNVPEQPEKYTFQCVYLTLPAPLFKKYTQETTPAFKDSAQTQYTNLNINALLKNPQVERSDFPILYASIGTSATNKQTKEVSIRDRFRVENKTIVYSKKKVEVGKELWIQLIQATGDTVSYRVQTKALKIGGFRGVEAGNNLIATLPYLDKQFIDTKVTQKLHTWLCITQNPIKPTKNRTFICIRTLAPSL